ncbi:MAG: hypothetical protein LC708_03690, partial [Actinobacteria bacterium]|nr:hypothetical protein [Actinomycetota bacterium]
HLLRRRISKATPAGAGAYPGLNGKLACGGSLPTSQFNVVDFEIYTFNPDGSERTNITDENSITDYNPLWTPDGTKILYESERPEQAVDDTSSSTS